MLGSFAFDSPSAAMLFPRHQLRGMKRAMDRRVDVGASSASGELTALLQAVSAGDDCAAPGGMSTQCAN